MLPKFRTWDGTQFHYWGFGVGDFEFVSPPTMLGRPATPASKLPHEQFTGRLDKNGKEIYEGDLLSVDNGVRICRVVWFYPQAQFDTSVERVVLDTPFRPLINGEWKHRCEVVGNIHQIAEEEK